jgi:subtilisin family serine protease
MTNADTTNCAGWRATLIAAVALAIAAAASAAPAGQAPPGPLMQLVDDPRPWTEKVAPDLVALAVSSTADLDVLLKLREPEAVHALTVSAQASTVRLQWIADTADGIERDWSAGGVRVLDRYSHIASVHVAVPVHALAALAEDTRVDAIVLNRKVHKLDALGNSYMHVNAIQPPNTGTGVGIAIMDTGVDWTHPELAPLGTKTIAFFDAYHTAGTPAYAMDDDGHGTEVAGVAGALGLNTSAIGTAPAATIVSVKILDSTGSGSESDIMNGINAVLTSVGAGNPYNIRAANFSLGGYDTGTGAAGVPTQPCDSEDPTMASAFQQLTDANVIPVVASGNGGCTVGVSWPACISSSLAVGSVYAQAFQSVSYSSKLQCNATGTTGCTDTSPNPGTVACYTDSGAKLDVWAPTCPLGEPLKGGGYDSNNFCGTSASAPYVSGLVALLAQASPTTSAASARLAVRNSGQAITDSRNGITRNVVQADLALAGLACTPLPAPATIGVNQTSMCSGEPAVVSWSTVPGATSYTIQVGTDNAFSSPTSAATTSPTYTFSSTQATSGTFYFRAQANTSCGGSWSGTAQVTYTPQCQSTYAHTYFLSGIARTPGVAPAFWYSDVSILNATTTPANVRITFYGISSFPPVYTDTLGGGQQLTFADVLGSLFAVAQDKGMIVVESNVPLQAVSRTYSKVTNGTTVNTYGQSYVGTESGQALTTAATGWFPALRSDGVFRTNIEFVNTSAVPTDVLVSFFTAGGSPIGTVTTTVPALRWTQIVRALPAGQASAFAKVQVLAGGAQILGSASVIDGNSTDPTTIPMWVQ